MHDEAVLNARLVELGARLASAEAELEQPCDPDVEERVTEREGDEALESLGSAGQSEIRMIEAALAGIAAGTFGICGACGEPISEDCVAVVRHAVRCRACA
jgi:RNA polymerase-binding transcription factor DksA